MVTLKITFANGYISELSGDEIAIREIVKIIEDDLILQKPFTNFAINHQKGQNQHILILANVMSFSVYYPNSQLAIISRKGFNDERCLIAYHLHMHLIDLEVIPTRRSFRQWLSRILNMWGDETHA